MMNTDESNLPFGDFEFTFRDYGTWRQIEVNSAIVRNRDVPYLRDLLAELRPELREFILETAKLICEAGE